MQHIPIKLWFLHMKRHMTSCKAVIFIFTVVRVTYLTGY